MEPDFRHPFDPHKHWVFFKIYRKSLFSVDGRLRISHLDHVESNNSKPKQNMSNTTQITTPESRKLISLWITGNDKKDARKLAKDHAWISTDISFWLQVIAECKAAKS